MHGLGLEVWKWSGIPDLLSTLVTTSGLGPCHIVHLGTVLNHADGLHMNKIAARPSTHQDSPQVHPDMVAEGPMVRSGVIAQWAKGHVYLYLGRDAVHHVCFFGRYSCHRGRMENIMQSDVLLFFVFAMVTVHRLIVAIHQHTDDQLGKGLLCSCHPLYLREGSSYEGLCLLEALIQVVGMFRNPGQQPFDSHEVTSVPILLVHVVTVFLQFFKQEAAVICSVDGF